jgi:TatD DNase family protein
VTLFDSHCHLDFAEFDADRSDVLWRAREAGVSELLMPGYEPAQWLRAGGVALAATERGLRVHVAVGVHPYALAAEAREWADRPAGLAATLSEAATMQGVVAIGECGLDAPLADRAGEACSLARQTAVLREHLTAARECGLPLVLHVVKAHGPALELLRAVPGPPHPRGVIHAFSGSPELVREYVDLGFMLGFGGALTRPTHEKARAAAVATPDEWLLVETDAPSGRLADGPSRNEPAALAQVVETLAQLRGQTVEHVAARTHANATRLFQLAR